MKYIKIKNTGLIEPEALHLVGASTKRLDETKIGQFGSGNKYAMAYLLRNQYEMIIYSGKNEIKITTEKSQFRDQDFDIVYINNEKTSITTQMGKDWKLWQSIREIYCNAMDEGDHSMEFVNEIDPQDGETHFYISNRPEMMKFIGNFDDYFTVNKELIFECPLGRIYKHSGSTVNIYRKGIRCYDDNRDSLFDYDFNEIEINESRVVESTWKLPRMVWELIFKCTDKGVIRKILKNLYEEKNVYEHNMNGVGSASTYMSPEFKEVLGEMKFVPEGYAGLMDSHELAGCVIIPTKLYAAIEDVLEEINKGSVFQSAYMQGFFKPFDPDPLQKETMRKVMEFFEECDFDIPYPIVTAYFAEKDVLGAACDGTIYISDVCITKGVNEIVNCIIEEFIHIKYQAPDETRKFQDAVIAEFIDYMKKSKAIAI